MKKKNKKMTLDTLAQMIGQGFADVDQKFIAVDRKIENLTNEMRDGFKKVDENFKQVNQQINNINLNIVDVVRKEEFDKLESRVTVVEEVVQLPLKK